MARYLVEIVKKLHSLTKLVLLKAEEKRERGKQHEKIQQEELKMLSKNKKSVLSLKIKLFNIRWYPSSKSCVPTKNHKVTAQQMPPLMVRKAEWRK